MSSSPSPSPFPPQLSGSPILAMARLAAEMRAAGHDVINLTLGEPDLGPPPHVLDAAREALDGPPLGYTPANGTPRLRDAIRRAFRRDRGLDYADDEVAVGCGAKQVIFNALLATLRPGDAVLIPAPYWASYPDMVRVCGAEPVVVPCDAASGFKLTPGALAAAVTPRTRWLVLNAPGNPSGAVYDAGELRALAAVLEGHPRVLVLSDDLYAPIRFAAPGAKLDPFPTLAAVAPALKERTLTVDGVSKAYGMTSWRVGWAGGPAGLVRAISAVQSQNCTQTSTLSQVAAALDGPQGVLEERRRVYQARRDAALTVLGRCSRLSVAAPDGAFYLFPQVRGMADTTELALRALQGGVALVAGAAFGSPGHLRLSFATDEATLVAGCERLVAVLDGSGRA